MPAYSEERKLEKDTINQLNEAAAGLRQQTPIAVYHYSASTTLHGRLFDGVIERPIIFSADCYQQVRREIASRIGANAHQVQVHSLSFIGESTPVTSS